MTAFIAFILMSLRLSTPLTFAALGGYCSERSGIVNIALEGMMLAGAFAAAAVAYYTHSAWLGIMGGMAGAVSLAALHGLLSIRFKTDQIISGIAVNLFSMGLAPVICKALYDTPGSTPSLQLADRLPSWFDISPLMLASYFTAFLFIMIHRHGLLGQYIRFAGENPDALATQGISVNKIRWIGVLLSGALCGLAGTYLSIDHGSGFARNMTAGRGYIALAALIVGRWTPQGAFIASLIFGAVESTQILLQGMTLPNGQTVPVQWIQMVPYIITLLILAGFIGKKWGKTRAPKALGVLTCLCLFSTLFCGCQLPDSAIVFFNENIGPIVHLKLERPVNKAVKMEEPPLPSDGDRHVNGEFIQEIFKVVLGRELRNQEEFMKYMNVLDQGGHYEGIYNGLVYSTEYKEKEKNIAPVGVVKAYADVMAQLRLDQLYDPLKIQNKNEPPDVPTEQKEVAPPQPTPAERAEFFSDFQSEGMSLSTFTLKRKLGEEILKTIDLKKSYREKLATWYGKFSVFMNKKGVNYGLTQRNTDNEYFLYKWALQATEDRLKWECLNRVHRLLNAKAQSQ